VWDAERMRNHLIRTRLHLLLAILLVAVLTLGGGTVGGLAAFGQSPQPPATILLIRHAEKLTDGRIDLSPVGFERAKVIPQLFGGGGRGGSAQSAEAGFSVCHALKRAVEPARGDDYAAERGAEDADQPRDRRQGLCDAGW
jgi:hypothetical protein